VAAFAALGVYWGAFGVLVPVLKDATGASEPQLGLALLAGAAGTFPAMVVAGRLADRYGERAIAGSLLAFAVAALGPAFADTPLALGAALLLCGAATGALDVTMNAAVAELEGTGRRLMNLAHAIFSLGFLVTSVAVGIARSVGVGRVAILGTVAIVLAGTALLNRAPARRAVAASGRRARLRRPLLVLGVLCALGLMVEGGVEAWSALHLEQTLGTGPATAGVALALFSGAMVSGRLSAQGLGEHVPDRLLLAGGAALAACGLTLTALAPVTPLALAGLVVTGLGASVTVPAILSITGRAAAPAARGAAISSVTTVAYLGFLVGPPLVGLMAGATSLRGGLRLLAAAAAALSTSALVLAPRT
jgi:MFS family permease